MLLNQGINWKQETGILLKFGQKFGENKKREQDNTNLTDMDL